MRFGASSHSAKRLNRAESDSRFRFKPGIDPGPKKQLTAFTLCSWQVWRPSENVVYELGAASKLWERRIIILREEGVNFPSDFKDLGYITFDGDDIATKALDLLRELDQLGLVRVQAA